MKIIVLQGVPASGKSTWAQQFVKENDGWAIVNRDTIRKGFGDGYKITDKAEQYVSECENDQVMNAIKSGFNVIIDATNLNPNTIKKWNDIAEYTGREIEFKEFKISFDEAVERDSKRENPVGEKVIKRFFRKYYPDELKAEVHHEIRNMKEPDFSLPNCIICDIDGTMAMMDGRSPYDYSKVIDDKVNFQLANLINTLDPSIKVIFMSCREDWCKDTTIQWLLNNVANIDKDYALFMRKSGDYRPDEIIKKELYEAHIEGKYNVLAVFDDRDKVVNMWRNELGLLCCQVWYGNF